jgi:hypothetical protein
MEIVLQKDILKDIDSSAVRKTVKKIKSKVDKSAKISPEMDSWINALCMFPDGKKTADFDKRKKYLQEIMGCGVIMDEIPYLPDFLRENKKGMNEFFAVIDEMRKYVNEQILD